MNQAGFVYDTKKSTRNIYSSSCVKCGKHFTSVNVVLVCSACQEARANGFHQRDRLFRFLRDCKGAKDAFLTFYGNCCLRCGDTTSLAIDHVKPVAMGGLSDMKNLQLLCQKCNSAKSDTVADYRRGKMLLHLSGYENFLTCASRKRKGTAQ